MFKVVMLKIGKEGVFKYKNVSYKDMLTRTKNLSIQEIRKSKSKKEKIVPYLVRNFCVHEEFQRQVEERFLHQMMN